MAKTQLGEIFITDQGNLVLTVNIPLLLKGLDPLSALFEGPSEEPSVGTSEDVPTKKENESKEEDKNDTKAAPVDGIDLFEFKEVGGNKIGGALEDLKGRNEITEMMNWLKDNKFNYRNFCRYLFSIDSLAGHPLSCPLIGTTQKGDPSLYKLATRYYHWWKSNKAVVAKAYNEFLTEQLAAMDVAIETVKEVMGGEEIDPDNLPKGIKLG